MERNERKCTDFIRIKVPYAKMKAAETMNQPIFIRGMAGYGKTELTRHFIGREKSIWYTCKQGWLRLEKGRETHLGTGITVVVDDLQFLERDEDRDKILSMMEESGNRVILISRGAMPPWINKIFIKNPFLIIDEQDLAWSQEDAEKYMNRRGVSADTKNLARLCEKAKGNAMMIELAATLAIQEGAFKPSQIRQAWELLEDYLQEEIVGEWKPELVEFLMYLSFLDEFTIPMAEQITGNNEAYGYLDRCRQLGAFLLEVEEGVYRLKPMLRSSLNKRARRIWGSERCKEIYYNTGRYYELQDQTVKALEMFEKSGRRDHIMELMIRNSRKNPGAGRYYELRKYYLELPDADLEKDAILMSGISMLYSLLMEPEKSEYWYQKLKEYEKKQSGAMKREAKSRLTYLDIALPHRGTSGILEIVKTAPNLILNPGLTMPEFSVTSNMPSLMNGGKDFSEWSKRDKELAGMLGKVMSIMLGGYGKGLCNIGVAESQYEKGGDSYAVLTMLSKGSMEAAAGGKFEMEFAAAGVQTRMNLFYGNREAAWNLVDSFAGRAREEKNEEIFRTAEAMKCRIALYDGDREAVNKWMEQAPDENREFFIMERYLYMTKIRGYLCQGDNISAMFLLEKMQTYAKNYKRTMIMIEAQTLMAVVMYRMKRPEWMDIFAGAIHLAEQYGFVRGIVEEGAAIKPLWHDKEFQKRIPQNNAFWKRLIRESGQMAQHYPAYLSESSIAVPELTEKAVRILQLQAEGYSYGQIAKELGIQVTTVKYHCSETYKKLGVSGKADAIMAARDLKLI